MTACAEARTVSQHLRTKRSAGQGRIPTRPYGWAGSRENSDHGLHSGCIRPRACFTHRGQCQTANSAKKHCSWPWKLAVAPSPPVHPPPQQEIRRRTETCTHAAGGNSAASSPAKPPDAAVRTAGPYTDANTTADSSDPRRAATLHAPQLRRRDAPTLVVELLLLRMLGPPLPIPLDAARLTPRSPAARQTQVRPERRERQHPLATPTQPARRRLHPRPHPTERHPLIHRERMSLAKRGQGVAHRFGIALATGPGSSLADRLAAARALREAVLRKLPNLLRRRCANTLPAVDGATRAACLALRGRVVPELPCRLRADRGDEK